MRKVTVKSEKGKSCWYNTNLEITKTYVWNNPLFAIYFLRKVVNLVMDEQIKLGPNNLNIPMELINIYELVERDLKRCKGLVLRLKYYVTYSTMLYTYIEQYLGVGRAYLIFEGAKLAVLYDEQLMVSFKAIPRVPGQHASYFKKLA